MQTIINTFGLLAMIYIVGLMLTLASVAEGGCGCDALSLHYRSVLQAIL